MTKFFHLLLRLGRGSDCMMKIDITYVHSGDRAHKTLLSVAMETKNAPKSRNSVSEQAAFLGLSSRGDNRPVASPPRGEKVDLNWKELQQELRNSRAQGHAGVAQATQKYLNEKKKQTGDHITLQHILGHDKVMDSSGGSSKTSTGWLARFSAGDNSHGSTSLKSAMPIPLKRFTSAPLPSGAGMRSTMNSTLSGHNGNQAALNSDGHTRNRDFNFAAAKSFEDVEESFLTQSNADHSIKPASTSTGEQSSSKGLMKQLADNVKLGKFTLDLSQSRQSASVLPTSSHALVSGLGAESQQDSTISVPSAVMSLRSAGNFLKSLRSPVNPEASELDRDEPPKADDQAANSKSPKDTKVDMLLEDFVPRRATASNGNQLSEAQKKRRSIIDQKVRRISMRDEAIAATAKIEHETFICSPDDTLLEGFVPRKSSGSNGLSVAQRKRQSIIDRKMKRMSIGDVLDEAMAATAKLAHESTIGSPELTSIDDSKPIQHSRPMELFPKRGHLISMDSSFIDGLLVLAPEHESRLCQMDMSVDGTDMSDNEGDDFDENVSLGDDSISSHSTGDKLDAGEWRQPSGSDELLEDFPTRSRHGSFGANSVQSNESPHRPSNEASDDLEDTAREIAIPVEAA